MSKCLRFGNKMAAELVVDDVVFTLDRPDAPSETPRRTTSSRQDDASERFLTVGPCGFGAYAQ